MSVSLVRPADETEALRILLVEDAPNVAEMIRRSLGRSRVGAFTVEVRGTLHDALDRLQSGPAPDAIVLDLLLPDAEGLVALTGLLANAPHLPIVVLSAVNDPSLRLEAIREGAQDFIPKSDVSGDRLALRVRFAVERDRWRIRLQKSVREARAEHMVLRHILEHAADGIVVVDAEGIVRFANPGAAELFGRRTAELVGSPFGHPIGGTGFDEIDVIGPGGKPRIAEVRSVATSWAGTPATVVSLRDVTEKRLVEQMRRDLVATLSHDIKSPLAAILGYAELLRGESLSEDARASIDRIEANVERATLLASNLVESIRVESGALEPRPGPVSVNEIVAKAVAAYDGAARRAGVSIRTHLDPAIPNLTLDASLVDRALVNLLSNAVRHSPHPGEVEVATRHDDRGVEVAVEDRGPGVPPDERPRLFRRFSLLTGSGSGSSGLGLHIVRSLTEAQGGSVRYETPPSGGARFTLHFPAVLPAKHDPHDTPR